jgi:hypothetical protein
MKNLQINVRTIEGENQVNCIGFFSGKFFNIDNLIHFQKDIYNHIEWNRKHLPYEDNTKGVEWYDVCEYMRVELLSKKS